MDLSPKYVFKTTETAFGTEHSFSGPGISNHVSGIHLLIIKKSITQEQIKWIVQHRDKKDVDYEAARICYLLEAAFGAGREDMRREVRDLIGAK